TAGSSTSRFSQARGSWAPEAETAEWATIRGVLCKSARARHRSGAGGEGPAGGQMLVEAEMLSSLIGQIYDVALDPNLWPSVLEGIAGFVRGPAAGLVWQDTANRDGGFYFSWGDDPHYTKLHWETYIKLQPFAVQWSMVPVGKVVSSADLMP